MPNGPVNPLQPLTDGARQINEQLNQAAKALGDSFTQTTNSLLQAASQAPLLPPLPGAQGNNPRNSRGNPNGPANGPQFPALQQLVPAQALQAVSQVEDVLLPPGVPRPSQALLQATRRRPAPVEEPMPEEPAAPAMRRAARAPGVEGTDGRSAARALGVQAV